jgi:predicted bacteriocin transport accessory protein
MKKKIVIIAISLVIVIAIGFLIYAGVVLNSNKKEESKYLQELKITELEEKIAKKESFILVISQTTCSHCAEYKPRLQKILAKNKVVGYFIEKDILSDEEVSRLNNIANISGTPTTVFIVNGEETSTATRIVGAKSTDAIISRLKAMGYIDK